MRTLIVPDIHQQISKVSALLRAFEPETDQTVLLGDYFDDFYDTPLDAKLAAEWLVGSLEVKRRIHLLGNHDYAYWKPTLQRCTGFSWLKHDQIGLILRNKHFKQLKTHVYVDDFLLSHAGYNLHFAHPIAGLSSDVLNDLDLEMEESHRHSKLPRLCWIGQERAGLHLYSGPLWQDWFTLKKVEGVNQIVGHTRDSVPRQYFGDYCLDTHLHHIGILTDGKLEVKAV